MNLKLGKIAIWTSMMQISSFVSYFTAPQAAGICDIEWQYDPSHPTTPLCWRTVEKLVASYPRTQA
jgi:hypothetical protein